MSNLIHRDRLLESLAEGVQALEEQTHGHAPIGAVTVTFMEADAVVLFTYLNVALAYLAGDVACDDSGNWTNADRVVVAPV